ncbi:MAG: hypothetical protein NZL92_12150, partial [Gloeomargarita sp. SKYG116]|nr:hypothetical protein [Gloeomargarita sp. SKYG116]MDW8402431.1 hypothetical protein [Gloeomargarita sp. SKYGB_i_bin116]
QCVANLCFGRPQRKLQEFDFVLENLRLQECFSKGPSSKVIEIIFSEVLALKKKSLMTSLGALDK